MGGVGEASETSSKAFSVGMDMSSFKGEVTQEQWLGERKVTQFG